MNWECRIKTVAPQRMLGVRTLTSAEALSGTLQRSLETTWAYLNSLESATVGPAIAVYSAARGEVLEVMAGFPVGEAVPPQGRVAAMDLPAGRAATVLHTGPYEQLARAHAALDEWMCTNGFQCGDMRYEIYWADPSQTQNPAELRTEIVCPLTG